MGHGKFFLATLVAFGLLGGSVADAALTVGFDQDTYVTQPTQSFQVQVHLDADWSSPATPALGPGLFSMGLRICMDEDYFGIDGPESIVLPAELDGDGLGGPAVRTIYMTTFGFGTAGAVDLMATEGYTDSLLATFTLETCCRPGDYTISLNPYYCAPQANFLDFEGNVLDSQITFGTATVHVVPEPSTVLLLLIATVSLAACRFRRRKRPVV